MRPLALGLRAPYRLKRTVALLAQATLSLNFTKGGPLDSRVTFSRASGGTSFRPVSYGPELIASQDLTTWVSGGAFGNWPGTTTTSSTITTTGANGARRVRMACTPATVYRMSGTVTGGTGPGSVAIAFGTSAGVYITHKDEAFVASGVASSVLLAPSNAAFVEFAVRGGNTGQTTSFASISASAVLLDRPGDPIQLFTAPANVPRFDYDPVSRRCRGVLVEEQRTNTFLWSNDFTNASWIKNPSGVGVAPQLSPQPVAAPDGTMTATRVTLTNMGTTSSDWSWLLSNQTCTAGITYCVSAFIRASTPGDVGKQIRFPGILGGVLVTLTEDWRLVENAGACPSTGTYGMGPRLRGSETTTTSVTLDIWQAQVEVGEKATSRIPTTGAAATRVAEMPVINTLSPWYNAAEGTLLIDVGGSKASSIAMAAAASLVGPNIGTNYIVPAFNSTGTSIIFSGGSNVATAAAVVGQAAKVAIGMSPTSQSLVVNGGTPVTRTAAAPLDVVSALLLGHYGSNPGALNGHIRRVAYWPRRMSNLDLQGLTR